MDSALISKRNEQKYSEAGVGPSSRNSPGATWREGPGRGAWGTRGGGGGGGRDGDVYTRGLKTPSTQEMSCGQKLS